MSTSGYAIPEYAVEPYGSGGLFAGVRGMPLVQAWIAFASDPGDDDPVWEDVSQYLRGFSTRRGREFELDRFQAGTASITLDNRDRRFDPDYTGSPYYPNVVPMRRVKIEAQWGAEYSVFDGYIDGWPQLYNQPHEARATVGATDAFKILSMTSYPSSVYAYEVQQDQPAHWWRMGEKQGAVAADSGSEPVSGTYSGLLNYSVSPGVSPYDDDSGMEFVDPSADGGGRFQVNTAVTSGDWTIEWWGRDLVTATYLMQGAQDPSSTPDYSWYFSSQRHDIYLIDSFGQQTYSSSYGTLMFTIQDPTGASGNAADPGWDGYVPPTGASPQTPTVNAGTSPLLIPTGYTDVTFPAGTYFNLDWHCTPEYEARDGMFWSQQFGFSGGDGGYCGLQANGILPDGSRSKVALFAIWQALNSQAGNADAIAGPFGGEGTGYRVIMPFEWETGRKYRLRVWSLSSDGSGNQWWGCWVKDTATNIETFVGQILVPAAWGDLRGDIIDFSERFAPAATTCSDIHYASALFGEWSANDGTVAPTSYSSRFPASVSCANAQLSTVPSMTNTVRHEMGTPAPDSTGAPGSATWANLFASQISSLADAGWHHVVVTKDDSTLTIYTDGVERNTTTFTGTPPGGVITGAPPAAGPGDVVAMDEVAIYHNALSAERVAAHYDAAVNAWAGESSDVRIGRALDRVGLPSGSRSLQTGISTMGAAVLNSQAVTEHIQDAALAEGGDFFVAKDGTATFYNRHHLITSPGNETQGTFGDDFQ